MGKYVMALDQGTTSSRCILFDKRGGIRSVVQREFEQIFPKPGWVEHDPMEIWASQIGVATEAMSKIGASSRRSRPLESRIRGDHDCVGEGHRKTCVQCHSVAVQAYIRHYRQTQGRGI